MVKTGMALSMVFLAIFSAAAGDISIAPFIKQEFGSTLYNFKVPAGAEEPGYNDQTVDILAKSELEYPLNVLLVGGTLHGNLPLAGQEHKRLTWLLSGWHNATQPFGKMKDSDWIGLTAQSMTGQTDAVMKFSYTESPANLEAWGGKIGIQFPTLNFFRRAWDLGLVYCIDYYKYDIRGIYSGWQYAVFDSEVVYDSTTGLPKKYFFKNLFPDTSVLAYQVTYHSVALTESWHPCRREKYDWTIDALFSPLTFAYDEDNHLLRFKKSHTHTYGITMALATGFTYRFNPQMALVVNGDARYARTSGTMTQKFYADDPGTPDNETGLSFGNIDAWIISLTGSLGMALQYTF